MAGQERRATGRFNIKSRSDVMIRGAVLGTVAFLALTGGMFHRASLLTLVPVSLWLLTAAAAMVALLRKSWCRGGDAALPGGDWPLIAGPFIIASFYGIQLLMSPVSYQSTVLASIHWLFLGAFSLGLLAAGRGRGGPAYLERGWLLVTGGLAVTALAAVYGLLPAPGAILRTADREVAAAGARLGGLLQYPNTFGAVMAAALLERLTALARMPGAAFTRPARWRGCGAGALAPVFALALLLTESRGAFAAAAAGWAAGWLLLRGRERLRYALHSAAALAVAAPLARQLAAAQLAPPALPGLLALAAGLAAASALSALAARSAERLGAPGDRRRGSGALAAGAVLHAAVPAAMLAAALGAALAFAGLRERLYSAATWLARGEMYADALRLLREWPWLGRGGDTWRWLHRTVQSRPYVGNEVHSGYLDLALDLGGIGLLALLVWLGFAVVRMRRSRMPGRLLPAFLVLLLHSAVDFDMSYGLYWMLVLWLAVWGLGPSGGSFGRRPGKTRRLVDRMNGKRRVQLDRLLAGGLAAVLLTGGLSAFRQAESLRLQRLAEVGPPGVRAAAESARLLERALALAPARPELRLALAGRLEAEAAAEVLRGGMAYERSHPGLALALGFALARQGDAAALGPLRRAAELDRYSRAVQTAALEGISLLADRLKSAGKLPQAASTASAGMEAFRRFHRLAEQTRQLRNDRGFRLTPEAVALARKLRAGAAGLPPPRPGEASARPR
ncbi:hypothetical protein FRY98_27170 [Paenibacillus faecis]|uniref:O-antigen ligase family protein n=1 Tax=Paenibacillus faecis TaxID=862114 RepID=A0A5D0CM52_9BACL|nr:MULTISPECIES: O-antigen ligase family protein [Paenibacillus]TYA10264.1 hypothetical protein FRY98_27170 [Paenibacillus faecis]